MASGPAFLVGARAAAIGAGFAVILWSTWRFYRAKTPIEPRHTLNALIKFGPFKYGCKPIYLGIALILVGWLLALGALPPVLIPYL